MAAGVPGFAQAGTVPYDRKADVNTRTCHGAQSIVSRLRSLRVEARLGCVMHVKADWRVDAGLGYRLGYSDELRIPYFCQGTDRSGV